MLLFWTYCILKNDLSILDLGIRKPWIHILLLTHYQNYKYIFYNLILLPSKNIKYLMRNEILSAILVNKWCHSHVMSWWCQSYDVTVATRAYSVLVSPEGIRKGTKNTCILEATTGLPWWPRCKQSACDAGDLGLILGLGRSLEKGTATHASILAWRIP